MSGRQASADLARELLEEIDIVGALGQQADGSSILWASGPTRCAIGRRSRGQH